MACIVIRDLEKFPSLQPVSIILLYLGSHSRCEYELSKVNIACALRWGVASVGIKPYWAWLTLYGKIFQVRDMRRVVIELYDYFCKVFGVH